MTKEQFADYVNEAYQAIMGKQSKLLEEHG
jgi:hypothetical protein